MPAKTILTLFLLFALILPAPLWAKDEAGDEPLSLRFDTLAAELKATSPALKANAANREALRSARGAIADTPDILASQSYGLQQLNSQLYQLNSGLNSSGLFDGSNPAAPPSYQDMALKQAVDAMLAATQAQVSAQQSQLSQTDRGYTSGSEISANLARLDDADLQIRMGGYRLYAGYGQAERSYSELEQRLQLLRRQQEVMAQQRALGMVTELEVLELEQGLIELEQGLQLAEIERRYLLIELNILLGRPGDAPLELAAMPVPDLDAIAAIDPEAAWSKVSKQNHALKALRYLQGGASQNHDETVRMFGSGGSRALQSGKQLEAAALNTELEEQRLRAGFHKTYERLQLDAATYRLQQARLERAASVWQQDQQRYRLGKLSALELQQQELLYLQQQHHTLQAQDDLTLSYQRWQLIEQGMSVTE